MPTRVDQESLENLAQAYGRQPYELDDVLVLDGFWPGVGNNESSSDHLGAIALERIAGLTWLADVEEVAGLPEMPEAVVTKNPELQHVLDSISHVGVCDACRAAMHQFDVLRPTVISPTPPA